MSLSPHGCLTAFHVLHRRVLSCLGLLILLAVSGCIDPLPTVTVHQAGIIAPGTYGASQVRLPLDTPIIGITVGGRARAYVLEAMAPDDPYDPKLLGYHVVNDVVDLVPVSVTFCDITGCKAAFTKGGSEPIQLFVGGTDGHEMVLSFDGQRFPQSGQNGPLKRYPHEVATWGEWKDRHPESDIYLGRLASEYAIGYVDPQFMGPTMP